MGKVEHNHGADRLSCELKSTGADGGPRCQNYALGGIAQAHEDPMHMWGFFEEKTKKRHHPKYYHLL